MQYDRIVEINGVEIRNLTDYYACIDDLKRGEEISVTVVRSKEQKQLTITIN